MYRFTQISQLFCSVLVVTVQFGLNYEKYCQQIIKPPETAPLQTPNGFKVCILRLNSVYTSLSGL